MSRAYRTNFLFILPAALVVLVMVAYPLGYAFWMSLTNQAIGSESRFIGLANYTSLILDDTFRKVVLNTLTFTLGGLVIKLLLGLAMALALNHIARGRNIISGVLLLPWIIPTVISTLVWKWMLDSSTGVINYVLVGTHVIDRPVAWLGTGLLAMISVIAVASWREIPYFGVSILAALKSIPQDQYEVAATEGANVWQRFWHVTLPNLRGIILLVSVLSTIQAAYDFAIIWMLTAGGPVNATHLFSTMSFETAFQAGNMARAVAISLIAFPIFAPIILLVARFIEKQEVV